MGEAGVRGRASRQLEGVQRGRGMGALCEKGSREAGRARRAWSQGRLVCFFEVGHRIECERNECDVRCGESTRLGAVGWAGTAVRVAGGHGPPLSAIRAQRQASASMPPARRPTHFDLQRPCLQGSDPGQLKRGPSAHTPCAYEEKTTLLSFSPWDAHSTHDVP